MENCPGFHHHYFRRVSDGWIPTFHFPASAQSSSGYVSYVAEKSQGVPFWEWATPGKDAHPSEVQFPTEEERVRETEKNVREEI